MRNRILGIVGLSFVLITAWFFYRAWVGVNNSVQALKYVPNKATLLIYGKPTIKSPLLQYPIELLDLLKETLPEDSLTQLFLKDKTLGFALCEESKNTLNWVAYIPVATQDKAFLEKIQTLANKTKGVRTLSRKFKKKEITEILDAEGHIKLRYWLTDDLFIFSESGTLIEDLVTHTQSNEVVGFLSSFDPQRGDSLQLVLNKDRLMNIEKSSFKEVAIFSEFLPENAHVSEKDYIESSIKTQSKWLKMSDNQENKKITLASKIPNNTATLWHWQMGNDKDFVNKLINLISDNTDRKDKISDYDLNISVFHQNIHQELAFCSLEDGGRLLIAKSLSPKTLSQYLAKESAKVRISDDSPMAKEVVGEQIIEKINLPEYPAVLLGPLFKGFPDATFFATIDDVVVMANSAQVLRGYLANVQNNYVWASSVKHNGILKRFQPAVFTMFVDFQKTKSNLDAALSPTVLPAINELLSRNGHIDNISLQVLGRSNNWKSRFSWQATQNKVSKSINQLVRLEGLSLAISPNSTPLFFASDSGQRMVFQDSQKRLVVLSDKGKTVYKTQLKSSIYGNIRPINYLDEQNPEFLFFADGMAKVLVFKGKESIIESFKADKWIKIEDFSVEESKPSMTKLTFADGKGRIWNLEKQNRKLKMLWESKGKIAFNKPLVPFTWKGISHFAGTREDGQVEVLNSFGVMAKHYPMATGMRIASPPVVELTNGDERFEIYLLSRIGDFVKISPEAKIVEQTQLERTLDTSFDFIFDQNRQDWFLVRKNEGFWELLDKTATSVFSIKNLNDKDYKLRYYNFGPELKIFALTLGKKTYLIDYQGNPLSSIPVTSTFLPRIQYSESYNKLLIYTFNGKYMDIWGLKL
jgi:hypothetical protein